MAQRALYERISHITHSWCCSSRRDDETNFPARTQRAKIVSNATHIRRAVNIYGDAFWLWRPPRKINWCVASPWDFFLIHRREWFMRRATANCLINSPGTCVCGSANFLLIKIMQIAVRNSITLYNSSLIGAESLFFFRCCAVTCLCWLC